MLMPPSILENNTVPSHLLKNDTLCPHFLEGKVHIKDKILSWGGIVSIFKIGKGTVIS